MSIPLLGLSQWRVLLGRYVQQAGLSVEVCYPALSYVCKTMCPSCCLTRSETDET